MLMITDIYVIYDAYFKVYCYCLFDHGLPKDPFLGGGGVLCIKILLTTSYMTKSNAC